MTTQQLLVPSNATLKRNVMDYSLIVVGSFLLQYPVDDSGDEKDRIVFRPEDDRYFLADLYIYRLIILFPYRSIGGERCLYRRLLRWSYFRLGRYLYFPGAKYECRYGCIGTCDR